MGYSWVLVTKLYPLFLSQYVAFTTPLINSIFLTRVREVRSETSRVHTNRRALPIFYLSKTILRNFFSQGVGFHSVLNDSP
jgi:hypothetical protein